MVQTSGDREDSIMVVSLCHEILIVGNYGSDEDLLQRFEQGLNLIKGW